MITRQQHLSNLCSLLERAVKQHCRHLANGQDDKNDIDTITYLTTLIQYSL